MDVPVELPKTKEQKNKAAEETILNIEKKHGEGAVFNFSRKSNIAMPHIPTKIYSLDHNVFGIGGAPRGRILEFYGPESSGKTTLALNIVASAQEDGGLAAYIDLEAALDPKWAEINGVNVKELTVSQPDSGEEALDIAEMLIESGAYSVVVVDSVSGLVPKAELEGEYGDSLPGLQARLLSQAMRKLTGKVRKSQTVLIFVNQIREKIGVMWGSPEVTSGGRALKFFASVRLDIRKSDKIKDGENIIGHVMKIKAVKNKVSTPYKETLVDLFFTSGVSREGNLLDIAAESDIIIKSGAWYSFEGERIGQGRTKAVETLRQNLDMQKKVLALLTEKRNKTNEANIVK